MLKTEMITTQNVIRLGRRPQQALKAVRPLDMKFRIAKIPASWAYAQHPPRDLYSYMSEAVIRI